jgi:hypothetical protein
VLSLPNAFEKYPEAMLSLPSAFEKYPEVMFPCPNAEEQNPVAVLPSPNAEERNPVAVLPSPYAVEPNPLAVLENPNAEVKYPLAVLRDPNAEELQLLAVLENPNAEELPKHAVLENPSDEEQFAFAMLQRPNADAFVPLAQFPLPTCIQARVLRSAEEKLDIPKDEVDISVYPPRALPTSKLPYEGAVVRPVPPYSTPTEVVAESTPLFACIGPFRVPRVKAENVFAPVNVFAVYVFGIVDEEFRYVLTRESR